MNHECIHLVVIYDGHGEHGHLGSGLIKTQLQMLVSKNKMTRDKV